MPTPYPRDQQQARAAKVAALVRTARDYPLTAAQVASLDDGGWAALAGLAGVNPPSLTSRDAVIRIVRDADMRTDPFAGTPGGQPKGQ